MTAAARLSARRAAGGQRVWVVFAEVRHHWWQRLLRRGFRHCFAAIEEADGGWIVVDPLSGWLVVSRVAVPAGFDLPGFYRRAGLTVSGPHAPGGPVPALVPTTLNCVSVVRSLLGASSPWAWTPQGLHRALEILAAARKKDLTPGRGTM